VRERASAKNVFNVQPGFNTDYTQEGRRQKLEGRRQKLEGRRQKLEGRRQNRNTATIEAKVKVKAEVKAEDFPQIEPIKYGKNNLSETVRRGTPFRGSGGARRVWLRLSLRIHHIRHIREEKRRLHHR
jgi:hypothetical protein